VKFDANGNWITTWGKPGSGNGEFNTPHGIAADADDNIYVADRGNSRIQVFDRDGKYLRQFVIKVPVPAGAQPWAGSALSSADADQENGAPAAICITPPVPGPPVVKQVLFTADWYPGRIYKVALDGTVLGVYGSSGHQLGQFGWINAIACPSENEVYVAELLNWRVQNLVVVPPSPSPDAR
jgi:sugar lactone lactonase YvrE